MSFEKAERAIESEKVVNGIGTEKTVVVDIHGASQSRGDCGMRSEPGTKSTANRASFREFGGILQCSDPCLTLMDVGCTYLMPNQFVVGAHLCSRMCFDLLTDVVGVSVLAQ